MASGLIIFGLISGGINAGLIIWFLVTFFKEREEPEDNTIAINFLSHLAQGRALGIETRVQKGKNGRHVVRMEARDVSVKNLKKGKNIVEFVVDKNKRILLAKGELSMERNISINLPPSASDFSKEFKEHWIGKFFMLLTEIINADNTEIDMLRIGSELKTDIMRRSGDGEVSAKHIEKLTDIVDIFNDLLRSVSEAKSKDKTTSISSAS